MGPLPTANTQKISIRIFSLKPVIISLYSSRDIPEFPPLSKSPTSKILHNLVSLIYHPLYTTSYQISLRQEGFFDGFTGNPMYEDGILFKRPSKL